MLKHNDEQELLNMLLKTAIYSKVNKKQKKHMISDYEQELLDEINEFTENNGTRDIYYIMKMKQLSYGVVRDILDEVKYLQQVDEIMGTPAECLTYMLEEECKKT
ncbi:hypothetical protein AGMMS49543_27520 [Betaproteobacteria bacterium]|nr:hypothetical protein AGMMS49543_27520 [Betaproteobacteria bacterium]